MLRHLFYLVALVSITASGCGDFLYPVSPASDPREDRKLAQGYTPCNDFPEPRRGVICHPNQYCAGQHLAFCASGCLSEDNCTEEQVCVKQSGYNVGSCVSRESLEWRRNTDDLDPGYTACGDPTNERRFSICHPNQYCDSDTLGICSLGCLSEYNCTERQYCDKYPGDHVGACMPEPW
jgi:hypothetical protein